MNGLYHDRSGDFQDLLRFARKCLCKSSKIGGANPENFTLGIFRFQPEKFGPRTGGLERGPAAADLAQQPSFGRQVMPCLAQYATNNVDSVGAPVEGDEPGASASDPVAPVAQPC